MPIMEEGTQDAGPIVIEGSWESAQKEIGAGTVPLQSPDPAAMLRFLCCDRNCHSFRDRLAQHWRGSRFQRYGLLEDGIEHRASGGDPCDSRGVLLLCDVRERNLEVGRRENRVDDGDGR